MTHHFILAGSLVLIACAYLRGVIGYVRYTRQRRFDLVDSHYRAAAMLANAKRMRDWIRWDNETLCGAFPDRAARDAALARATARHQVAEAARSQVSA
ncbi:hypothetical protein [Xanthomonas campestris]|uniref:hypothetical protein n=1 Tax=Xanthomonas campestris TaxID=339 RepID=UPI002B22C355|nr:hypothetical protein [Xanthomonas campestris]MEA9922620.1 hypothetical protein [Xanthomonas campestris pv. raphani]MEA9947487.1 hypothetical protein [Xanthomonas campestris pv. raphani]